MFDFKIQTSNTSLFFKTILISNRNITPLDTKMAYSYRWPLLYYALRRDFLNFFFMFRILGQNQEKVSFLSADTHASSPVLTTISFRWPITRACSFWIFSKQICDVEALICHFHKNIKTLTQIHFPRDAHIFRTWTIFYRHYKGLHQMRKDLVLCALWRDFLNFFFIFRILGQN